MKRLIEQPRTARRRAKRSRTLTAFALAAGLAFAAAVPSGALAQEADVELITGAPPSASSLADTLYPEPTRTTRSIRLADQPVVPKAVGFLIQFGFDSADIQPESLPYLDEVGKMLHLERVRDQKLEVSGHADASGSDSYNLALSKRRADSVANYLVRKHNIDPDRLIAVGHGEAKPLKGHAPTAAENRRVQFQAVK